MAESWQSRFARYGFNLFPAYRGTGARVAYIASDWREVRIELPLSWRTRNYVGTIFGGSMYASIDPMYMLMLIKILGDGYIVWDKAAKIRFKKPGKSRLFATFTISEGEIDTIKNQLVSESSIDRVYNVDLLDANGVVHASVEKTIYIRKKKR